ncbi:MAG: demethoxyubiquinone hydroxylase family protein [Alphaproteobacteria bacterium]
MLHPSHESEIPLFPGQASRTSHLDEMLRVDLAGEMGAKRIYEGQLWVLKKLKPHHPSIGMIEHMYAQECEHADQFQKLLQAHHGRPTFLAPLWHVTGFMLGAASAALSPKAAMACTVAVEEVIDEHYQEQIASLPESQQILSNFLEKCRQEEVEHRDQGYAYGAKEMPLFQFFAAGVRAATRLAIFLSKRF